MAILTLTRLQEAASEQIEQIRPGEGQAAVEQIRLGEGQAAIEQIRPGEGQVTVEVQGKDRLL